MSTAELIPLSDIAEINPPRKTLQLADADEVSFIPMSDVTDSARWVGNQTRKLREVRSGYTYFEEGDVLFAKITPCTENGKGCLAVGLRNGIGFGSTEFHVLRARSNADPRFIFQWTIAASLRSQAAAQMIGSAGQQRVPEDFLSRFQIPALSRSEQTAIAEILATVDQAIAQTEALIAKQRRIKAGLLHDLLTRGIDEAGNLRHPSTHRFKESPVGPVPVEWEVGSVDEITSFVGSGITPTGGSQVYGHEGIVFIRSQNVYNDGLVLDDIAYIDETINQRMHRTQVFSNDVLLNITGASIGRCCFVPDGFPAANVNQHVCIIRQNDVTIADAIFLSAYIASPFGQRQIKMLNAGGNREGLNYQEVRNILVPCPTREEKEEFARLYTKMNQTIAQEENTLAKLHRLKSGLMQDLLSGRVSVAGVIESTSRPE